MIKVNVLSEENSWYRNYSFYEFTKIFAKSLDTFSERLGYGGSMGAYGVSAYANILKIDRVLLMNPISTLNEVKVPFETRFIEDGKKYDWNTGAFDGADMTSKGYIIYDPIFDLDKKHADRFNNKIIHLKVPGVGHMMPEHLKQMGMIKWIFMDFVNDILDIRLFQSEARKRKNLPRYYEWMCSTENIHLTEYRKKIILKYKHLNLKSEDIPKSRNLTNKQIDILRDIALFLEEIDIDKAYELMNMANQLRPTGVGIRKKLAQKKRLAVSDKPLISY